MDESRFHELYQQLLNAGVAPRHARRALWEFESHFHQLLEEQLESCTNADTARSEAHRRLGEDRALLRSYAERPELRAWSRRWPSVCFTLVPLLVFAALTFASLFGIWSVAHVLGPSLLPAQLSPESTREIQSVASVALLWVLPLCVAAGFARLAGERRLAPRWPLLAILLVSILASVSNVLVTISGGADRGTIGAGIGFFTDSWAEPALHAAILMASSSLLLWALHRGRRRSRLS